MSITGKSLIAALAVASLGVAACSGEGTETSSPTPEEQVTDVVSEEPTAQESEPTGEESPEATEEEPAEQLDDEFPFVEGEVDPGELQEFVRAGMESASFVTMETSVPGQEGGVVAHFDMSDPAAPTLYRINSSESREVEIVEHEGVFHTREDQGEWAEGQAALPEENWYYMSPDFEEAQLLDSGERQFQVVVAAHPEGGSEAYDAYYYFDDSNRLVRVEQSADIEVPLDEATELATTEYTYDEPVEFPDPTS